MMPKADPPFAPEVVRYISRRLRALGIAADRDWLDTSADEFDMLLDSHVNMLKAARRDIPTSWAQWEMADFYRYAIPPAVFDLSFGFIETYEAFAFLYERLLGREARPWLRSIYLAAAASPNMDGRRVPRQAGRIISARSSPVRCRRGASRLIRDQRPIWLNLAPLAGSSKTPLPVIRV